jgi:hypothetical protein
MRELPMPRSASQVFEGIYDFEPVNASTLLEVFTVENSATGIQGGANHQGIPDGEVVKAVEVDRREDIFDGEDHHIEPAEQLDSLPCAIRGDLELLRCDRKVLLKDLKG